MAISMNVTAGFSDTAKASKWMPITVSMVNNSSEDVAGTLIAAQVEPEKNTPVCAAPVILPANSKKLYHVYTKIAGYGASMQVSFVHTNGATDTKKVNVNAATEDDKLIVSVGNRASRLSFLSGEKLPVKTKPVPNTYGGPQPPPSPTEATIFPTSIEPNALPDRPAAYESVDMLVLSDFDSSSVRPDALKAIGMWVASGGTLVISTGADYKRFTNDFYGDLLPVKITGAASVPGLPTLGSFGKTAFPSGATTVAMSTVKPGIGKVIVSESGTPILVERNYGSGKVVFIALDISSQPFNSWNGQTQFWKNLLKSEPAGPLVETAKGFIEDNGPGYMSQNEGARPAMSGVVTQSVNVKTPTISTIGLFLIAYLIVLVPVNYFVLKQRRKLELAWITTPVIVLVFTLGAYAIGYTMKGGRLQLREATLIEGSANARYARVVSDASLFSPARRRYNIEIDDKYAISQAIPDDSTDAIAPALLADTTIINDVPMAMWSNKLFESVSGVDLGGEIKTNLTLTGGHVRGTITNETGITFTECAVVCGSASSPVGNIGPGATVKIDIAQAPAPNNQSRYPYQNPSNDLGYSLNTFAKDQAGYAGCPILVARGSGDGEYSIKGLSHDRQAGKVYVFRLL
ncbi:MAG: hypothetical protein ABFD83_09280 [Armatimonadota bacterium]